MGLRVVHSDGSPVGQAASFLRNLLRFADTFFFLCPVALVSMVSSPGFRRLGDWVGNTLVVYAQKVKAYSGLRGSAWLERFTPIAPAAPLSYEEKQAILIFARRYPLLGEARANEIAGTYAASLREEEAAKNGHISNATYLLGVARLLSGNRPADNARAGKVL
jgi:hypothetical protein